MEMITFAGKVAVKAAIKSGAAHEAVKATDEVTEILIDGVRKIGENFAPDVIEAGIDITMDVAEIGKDIVVGAAEEVLDFAEETLDFVDDTLGDVGAFFSDLF